MSGRNNRFNFPPDQAMCPLSACSLLPTLVCVGRLAWRPATSRHTCALFARSHSRALSGDCTASRRLRSLDVGIELAVARPLVVVQRTAVGGDVHAANLAIVPKLARAAF